MKKLLALIVAGVTGCAGAKGTPMPSAPRAPVTTSNVKRITVTPGEQVLAPGHTANLMAAVYMMDGQITANVNWASSDDTVATVTTEGRVTAIKEGVVTITARSALEPNRFGICALLVSTCASCGVPTAPLVDRGDTGVAVTEAEQAALNNVLNEYEVAADNPVVQSYLLNKRGQEPTRELMYENPPHYNKVAPVAAATPRTTWLACELMLNSSRTLTSALYFQDGQERGDRGVPVRLLFYKADASWVKDVATETGKQLFIDDLPVGEVLVGRMVAQNNGFTHESWSRPFVLSKNRKEVSTGRNLVPQLDFNLKMGPYW